MRTKKTQQTEKINEIRQPWASLPSVTFEGERDGGHCGTGDLQPGIPIGCAMGYDSDAQPGPALTDPGHDLPSTAIAGRPMTDSTNSKKPSGIPLGCGSFNKEHANMTTKSTRRAILAGAAMLPALAVPAFAVPAGTDPIFAAIERHKVAFRASQAASNIESETINAEWAPDYDPVEWKAVQEAATAANDAAADAANALTTIRPTTIAGLLALMHHVEAFNAGAFTLDIDPDNWQSRPADWPAHVGDDEIDLFGYSVLANVRRALESLAVQS